MALATSTTTMTQTITDSAGNVTTQTRDVVLTSCGRINCGSYDTYTDVYLQTTQQQTFKLQLDLTLQNHQIETIIGQ